MGFRNPKSPWACPLAVRSGFLGHKSPSVAKNSTGPDRRPHKVDLGGGSPPRIAAICHAAHGVGRNHRMINGGISPPTRHSVAPNGASGSFCDVFPGWRPKRPYPGLHSAVPYGDKGSRSVGVERAWTTTGRLTACGVPQQLDHLSCVR